MSEATARRPDQQKVALYKLFSFADRSDAVLMGVGTVSGIANGCARPLMALFVGRAINKFGSIDPSHIVEELSEVCMYIFNLNPHINQA